MKKFWDLYAYAYDLLRTFRPYVRMQERVIARAQLIPNLRILDVGCGTGNTIEMLAGLENRPWGMKIVGLEQSPNMLNRASRKLKEASGVFLCGGGYDKIPIVGGDCEKYDRIISVNSLYVSADPRQTLRHWYERLEDGGILVVSNPFIPKQTPILREYFRGIWTEKDIKELLKFLKSFPRWLLLVGFNIYISRRARQKVFHFLEPDVLQSLVVAAGFKILSREIVYGGGSVLISAQKDENAPVRRAQTLEEIEEVFRLRYNKYCLAMKMVDPAGCRDGQETDRFDSFATHFIARDNRKIVGSIRYFPDTGNGFLLEEYFTLPPEIATREVRRITIEISRATLLVRYGGGPFLMTLLEEVVKSALVHGYSCFIGATTKKIWSNIEKNSGEVKIWEEFRKDYHKTCSAPGFFCLSFKKDDKFNKIYLGSPGRRIFHKYLPWSPGISGGHEI